MKKNKSKLEKSLLRHKKKAEIDQNSSQKPHNTVYCGERHYDTITTCKNSDASAPA